MSNHLVQDTEREREKVQEEEKRKVQTSNCYQLLLWWEDVVLIDAVDDVCRKDQR